MLLMSKRTRKHPQLGKYPACDHLNVALRMLLKKPEENRVAIEEICYAIQNAGGYFYDSVAEELELFRGAKMDAEVQDD